MKEGMHSMEFLLNVSLKSANSVTKIFVLLVKGLEPTTQPPLVLPRCQQDKFRKNSNECMFCFIILLKKSGQRIV